MPADWIGAASTVAGAVLGGKPAPATSGAYADSIFSTNIGFDNSGWNVAFPNSSIESVSDKTSSQGADLQGGTAFQSIDRYLPYAVLFVGALIAYRAFK